VLLKFKQIDVAWVTVVVIMGTKVLDLVVQVQTLQLEIVAIGGKGLQFRLALPVAGMGGMLV
jgi:hypothetical protein